MKNRNGCRLESRTAHLRLLLLLRLLQLLRRTHLGLLLHLSGRRELALDIQTQALLLQPLY